MPILAGDPILAKRTLEDMVGLGSIFASVNPKRKIQRRLYKNLTPVSYLNAPDRVRDAIILNRPDTAYYDAIGFDAGKHWKSKAAIPSDPIFAKYLNIPKSEQRKVPYKLIESKYKPSVSKDKNAKYYKEPILGTKVEGNLNKLRNNLFNELINEGLFLNTNGSINSKILSGTLGNHKLSKGRDSKGDYISYYDLWDLSPFNKQGNDDKFNIGQPVEFYDRYHLDDIMGLGSNSILGSYWLPQIEVLYDKYNNSTRIRYGSGNNDYIYK